ncbi:hypothetical protein [Actinomadura rupiterrae]|uniref:hypothetical protein n=1 Tax=Actinomadura rupiterrae TaxID=559627 RepID=UPI0020A37D76|nr:hypothetical protein [Actinomadura rupiterrae]MCP2341161.1 hypothetical protein [Actinomadura rupiterrae]
MRDYVTIRWTKSSWRINVPLLDDDTHGTGLAEAAQIHLPRLQLPQLNDTLAQLPALHLTP